MDRVAVRKHPHWIGYKCSSSPTGSHVLYEGSKEFSGTVFYCIHCGGSKWQPDTVADAIRMSQLMRTHGEAEGYRMMLTAAMRKSSGRSVAVASDISELLSQLAQ